MEEQLNSDIDLKKFVKILSKYRYIIYTTTIIVTTIGLIYLKFQVPIYSAYSIVKVKSDDKNKDKNMVLDLYSYGNNNIKEDIALLKTFYINKKAIDSNSKDFKVQYFKDKELYRESPIEVEEIEIVTRDIPANKIILTPKDGDSFSIEIEKDLQTKLLSTLKQDIPSKVRVFKYNQIVNTKYFKFKVKKLSNFDGKIAIKINGDSRNIYEKIIRTKLKVEQLEDEVAIIKISYNDNIKKRAIKYIDTLTDIFIKESILSKSEQSNRVLEFINRELNKMRDRLGKSERELETYRVSNNVISPSAQASTLIKDLSGIDIKISQNRIKKELIDNLVAIVKRDYRVDALAPALMQLNEKPTLKLIEMLQKSELKRTQLLSEFTYKHPEVIATQKSINSLRKQIKRNILNLQKQINLVYRDLINTKLSYEKNLKKLPTKERKLINLKRDYEVSSKMYNFLLEKQAENEIIKASTISDYKIIDKAYSSDIPISPKRGFVIVASILLGIILGTVLAILKGLLSKEIFDIGYIKEIGIRLYGEVIKGFLINGKLEHRDSRVLQSYRDIRANLQLILKDIKEPKKIFVSAISYNKSKDIFSANLGYIFQVAEYKTVILDLNFKKPLIDKIFRLHGINDGVSNYLKSDCDIDSIIYPTRYKNLHIIPAGDAYNSYDILLSQRLEHLISQLETQYDFIILNGASFRDIPDIKQLLLISTLNIIFVKQDFTKKRELEEIKEIINEFSISNIGVVFEKTKP